MVRLGVRVIHKITSEAKAQPIIEPDPPTLSKSLRLRLSPKALKLANKFSTSVDENQHRELNGQRSGISCIGSMSRIDIEKHSTNPDVKQSTFFASKVEHRSNGFSFFYFPRNMARIYFHFWRWNAISEDFNLISFFSKWSFFFTVSIKYICLSVDMFIVALHVFPFMTTKFQFQTIEHIAWLFPFSFNNLNSVHISAGAIVYQE